jgi:ribosomal protein S18
MRRQTKTCPFCEARVHYVDYKDDRSLGRFITDHGKILPSRLSGVCARYQACALPGPDSVPARSRWRVRRTPR